MMDRFVPRTAGPADRSAPGPAPSCAAGRDHRRPAGPAVRGLVVAAGLGVAAGSARAQIELPFLNLGGRVLVVENARMMTMDGPDIDRGTLVVRGGVIAAVGAAVEVPEGATRIDAAGRVVTPGLIDADSRLGMTDTGGSADATNRATDAFDAYATPDFREAVRFGVTTVAVSPAGRGLAGVSAVVRLAPRDQGGGGEVLVAEQALCINLGSGDSPVQRMRTFGEVRSAFRAAIDARAARELYDEELAEYEKKIQERAAKAAAAKPADAKPADSKPADSKPGDAKPGDPKTAPAKQGEAPAADAEPKKPAEPARDPRSELLLRAIDRELPVRIEAHRSADILSAIELAREFGLRLVIEGATQAGPVADDIAAAGATVLLGEVFDASRLGLDAPAGGRAALARALTAAGVGWRIGSGTADGDGTRFVLDRALDASSGADAAVALKLVTADAADALGIGSKAGRLRRGMPADFVIWSGDPADPASRVEATYVGGTRAYSTPGAEGGT